MIGIFGGQGMGKKAGAPPQVPKTRRVTRRYYWGCRKIGQEVSKDWSVSYRESVDMKGRTMSIDGGCQLFGQTGTERI